VTEWSGVRALLISTYEMGRQPFGLASPAAWLRREGIEVQCADLAKEKLGADDIRCAGLVAFHLPMHTATRLATPVISMVRSTNPSARICAYGVYAPLNADRLRSLGVDDVLGGEFEEELTTIARQLRDRRARPFGPAESERDIGDVASGAGSNRTRPTSRLIPLRKSVPRLHFLVPDRSTLPPLTRYATLQLGGGARRTVGYTEASRGCRHLCRHCPIVPIYEGQFRVVQPEVVLADIAAQVAAGAEHITFGDPDFFNGPTHAMRIVEALHRAHPALSYDVTIKVEHLLRHQELLPRLRSTGCLFVTTAVESLDDAVLARFDKGHTREDFFAVVALCRRAGLTLIPTFVAFHPWTTLAAYCDLVDTIEVQDLIDHVAPIQLAIRLLIPQGSRLLELEEMRRMCTAFDPATLTYRWVHSDSEVDRLHDEIASIVGSRLTTNRGAVFDRIAALAHERAGIPRPDPRPARDRAVVPYLNEPWYC
jgi:radical SAM superfamily enzyme YgiQ (UPF0313 family)